eukprot:10125554-Heterocapsa_arctica.AAC.1
MGWEGGPAALTSGAVLAGWVGASVRALTVRVSVGCVVHLGLGGWGMSVFFGLSPNRVFVGSREHDLRVTGNSLLEFSLLLFDGYTGVLFH